MTDCSLRIPLTPHHQERYRILDNKYIATKHLMVVATWKTHTGCRHKAPSMFQAQARESVAMRFAIEEKPQHKPFPTTIACVTSRVSLETFSAILLIKRRVQSTFAARAWWVMATFQPIAKMDSALSLLFQCKILRPFKFLLVNMAFICLLVCKLSCFLVTVSRCPAVLWTDLLFD